MVDYNPDLPDLTTPTLEPHHPTTTTQDPKKPASKSKKPAPVTNLTTTGGTREFGDVVTNEETSFRDPPAPSGIKLEPEPTTALKGSHRLSNSHHPQSSPELEVSGRISPVPGEPHPTTTVTTYHFNGTEDRDGTTIKTVKTRGDPIRSEGLDSIERGTTEPTPIPKRRKIIRRYQPKPIENVIIRGSREVTGVYVPSEPRGGPELGEGEEGEGSRVTRSKTRGVKVTIPEGSEKPGESPGSERVEEPSITTRVRKGRPRIPEDDGNQEEVREAEHPSVLSESIGTGAPDELGEPSVPKRTRKPKVTKLKAPVKLPEPEGAEKPGGSENPDTIPVSENAEGPGEPKESHNSTGSDEPRPVRKVRTPRAGVPKRAKVPENPDEPDKIGEPGELIESREPEVPKKLRKPRVSKPKGSMTPPEPTEPEGSNESANNQGAGTSGESANLTEPGEPIESRGSGEPEVPKKPRRPRTLKSKPSMTSPDPNEPEGPDGLVNSPGVGASRESENLTEPGGTIESRGSGEPEAPKKPRRPRVSKPKVSMAPPDPTEPEGSNGLVDSQGVGASRESENLTEPGEPQPPQKVRKPRAKVPKVPEVPREPKESEEPGQLGGSDHREGEEPSGKPQGSDEQMNPEVSELLRKPKRTRATKPKVPKRLPGAEEPEGSHLAEGAGDPNESEMPQKPKRTRVTKPKVAKESQEPRGTEEASELTEITEPMRPKQSKEPKSKVPKSTPDVPFCPSIGWDRGHWNQERSLLDSKEYQLSLPSNLHHQAGPGKEGVGQTNKRGKGVGNLEFEPGVNSHPELESDVSILATPNPTKKFRPSHGSKKLKKAPLKSQLNQPIRESIPPDRERIAAILATKLTLPNIEDPSLFEGPSNKRAASFDLHVTDLDYSWHRQLPTTLPTPSSLTESEVDPYRPPPLAESMERIQVVGDEQPIHLPINGSHPLPTGYIFNTGLDPYAMEHCPGGTHLAIAGRHTPSPTRLGEIQPGRGVIQLWNLQGEGYLETTLCHEFGSILSLRWLPRYAPNLLGPNPTHLGLLALVGSTGEVYVIPAVTGAPYVKVDAIYRFSLTNLVFTCCDWSPCSHPGRLVAGTLTGDAVAWDLFTSLPEVLTRLATGEGAVTTPLASPPRYISRSHLSLITAIKFTYEPSMGLGVVTSGTDGFVSVHFWSNPHQFFRLHNQKSPVDYLATCPSPYCRYPRVIYPDNTNCLRWAALTTDLKKDRRRLFHIGLTLATTLAGTDHHNLLATGTLDGRVTVTESPFPHRIRQQQPEQYPIFQFHWDPERHLLIIHCRPTVPQVIPLTRPDKPILDPTPRLPPVYLRSLSWNPAFTLLLTAPTPPPSDDPILQPPLLNAIDLPPSHPTGFQLAASTTGGICVVTQLIPTPPPPPGEVEVGGGVPPMSGIATGIPPHPQVDPPSDTQGASTPAPLGGQGHPLSNLGSPSKLGVPPLPTSITTREGELDVDPDPW